MKLKQIGTAAAALGNQIKAGIPIDQALIRLGQMQPAYADFWQRATLTVQSGKPLSDVLVEIWPETMIAAVKAGERSGTLDTVFGRIEETVELQLQLRATMLKLAYPLGMGLAGIVVFCGFMIFVLPGLAKSLNTKSAGMVFELSAWMSAAAQENPTTLAAGLVVGIVALVAWLRTAEAQALILDVLLQVPVVKIALRDMYFGLWANYVAMMVASGITTTESLRLTKVILPSALQESVAVFESDLSVNNRSMSDAANLSKQKPGDARATWWPFYIANAFIVAEQTGLVDQELLRVAPSLIKEGVSTLNTVIAVANVGALALSATLIVSPLAAYYAEIFAAIQHAGR